MKRNDFATFLTYLLMIGLAVLVGLVWIRPALTNYGSSLPIPGIVLVLIAMVVGILLNASLLELGHLLGAKTGKYRVRSFVILGMGFKLKDNKKKWGFHSFSGLTGETKVAPLDPETSRLGGYIVFPILFFLVEIIVCAVLVGISNANGSDLGWLNISGITLMGIAGIILIYDYFPAHIDESNDGWLMMITSKPVNKVAFNNLLLAEEATELGKPLPKARVYEEVTDFTYYINNISTYRAIDNKDYRTAIKILDLALNTEKGLSKENKENARCLKLTLLLGDPRTFSEGKKMYEGFEDDTKSYISALTSPVAVRSYILISSFVEQSEGECNYAIEKAQKALKGEDEMVGAIEKRLLEENVALVREMHPGWTVALLPWQEEAENKAEGEEK